MSDEKLSVIAPATALQDSDPFYTLQGAGPIKRRKGIMSQIRTYVRSGQTLTDLFDTPANYSGSALYKLRVNAGETGVEFTPDAGGSGVENKNTTFVDADATPVELEIAATISDAIDEIYEEIVGVAVLGVDSWTIPDDGKANDYWAGGTFVISGTAYSIIASTNVSIQVSINHASETGNATKNKANIDNKYTIVVNNPTDAGNFIIPRNVRIESRYNTVLSGAVTSKDSSSLFVVGLGGALSAISDLRGFVFDTGSSLVCQDDATHGTGGGLQLADCLFQISASGVAKTGSAGLPIFFTDCVFFGDTGRTTSTNKIIDSSSNPLQVTMQFLRCQMFNSYLELNGSTFTRVFMEDCTIENTGGNESYFLGSGTSQHQIRFFGREVREIEFDGTGGGLTIDMVNTFSEDVRVQQVSAVNVDINIKDTFVEIITDNSTAGATITITPPFNKNNFTTAPGANDDSANTSGNGWFSVGSKVTDSTNKKTYTCTVSTPTSAEWEQESNEAGGDPNFVGEDATATPSATGIDSLAMGPGSVAVNLNSIAIGKNSVESVGNGAENILIGNNARTISDYVYRSIAIGKNAYARYYSYDAIAIGTDAKAKSYSNGSVAIGHGAETDSPRAISIGKNAGVTSSSDDICIGYNAAGSGNGVTIGKNAKSSIGLGMAIGYNARCFNEQTWALYGVPISRRDTNFIASEINDPAKRRNQLNCPEIMLWTAELDLLAIGNDTVQIRGTEVFYCTEIGLVITEQTGSAITALQCEWKASGGTAFQAPVAISANVVNKREILTAGNQDIGIVGAQTLIGGVTTAGLTATTAKGKFYFKGFFIED